MALPPMAAISVGTHRHLTKALRYVGDGLIGHQTDIIRDLLTMRPIWDYRYEWSASRSKEHNREKGKWHEKRLDGRGWKILIIKVNLTKDFGPSSWKKSIIIAFTEGNISVPNREKGLYVYRTK
jgi:hypothetical protein